MAMEETFQFIIESPQYSAGQKKRPRLVTSCDNCRLKKIKCLQPNPEAKCEACKTAKIPCRFKDREKYFAERSRAIATPPTPLHVAPDSRADLPPITDIHAASTSSSPSVSPADVRQSSRSPKTTTGLVSPDSEYARYQPYPSASDSRRPRHAGSSSMGPFHSRSSSHNTALGGYEYPSQPVIQLQLFDPDNPLQPHPQLLQQFIPLFFEQYGRDYPFLNQDDIYRNFVDKRLPAILANCVAAMACRHHSNPDVATASVEMAYSAQAKHIFAQQPPSQKQNLPTVQALVLLGWYDYYRNQFEGFRQFTQIAMQLGYEMRLPEYKYVQPPEHERNIPPITWAHVVHMQQTLASAAPRTNGIPRIF